MRYRVTTLTPTLVGDGTKLAPIDYMVWRDQVNVLDQNRIFRLLARGPRLEGYLTQLRTATKLDFASWGGFAQNFAGRRIPFEDATCTPHWNSAPVESLHIPAFASDAAGPFLPGAAIKGALRTAAVFAHAKPNAIRDIANQLTGERTPRHPAEHFEQQTIGAGGSDRMRAVSITDSEHTSRDAFRVYVLRLSTLVSKVPNQYSLGWKQGSRSVEGQRPEDATPSFAEMAAPGVTFEGEWRENAFLNSEEIRKALRWNKPVTHQTLFEAANQYADKQLELHAQYAEWTGLESLGASIADLRKRLDTARNNESCLLAIGWGAGFLSKSAAIGMDEAEHRKVLAMLPYYERAIRTGLPFPKTRRVVFLKNKPATLPGWVELSVA
ncbi:MAG TPA: type III-A CRISPR-associated RAMP protein Csm5 [Bryobacteraceae bacterium]|nr:type III-A CRISPR-associated RAMP protein Csm5 [Bryobacteraceae bacterium]